MSYEVVLGARNSMNFLTLKPFFFSMYYPNFFSMNLSKDENVRIVYSK